MRILFLIGALFFIIAAARRWDQLHPLRVGARAARASGMAAGGALDGHSSYLDLTLLDRRRPRSQAARREAAYATTSLAARRIA